MADQSPVTVSIVGTDVAGSPLPSGTIGVTPAAMPDVRVNLVSPAIAIAVRAGNVFLTTWLATIGAGAVGVTPDIATWKYAAAVAATAASIEAVRSLVTILGRLENKYPLWTGSI